jgi:hypothetical protein
LTHLGGQDAPRRHEESGKHSSWQHVPDDGAALVGAAAGGTTIMAGCGDIGIGSKNCPRAGETASRANRQTTTRRFGIGDPFGRSLIN